MEAVSAFFKRKDVVISAHRYGIDAMGAMAQGLFASLLIGTIIKTLGQQLGLTFLVTAPMNWAVQAAPWPSTSSPSSPPRSASWSAKRPRSTSSSPRRSPFWWVWA